MSASANPIASLIAHLVDGWREAHPEIANDLIHHWKEKLGATVEIKEIEDHWLRFQMDLSAIRLLGMNDVHCLLAGGESASTARASREFWARHSDVGRSLMILAGSDSLFWQIKALVPPGVCLILSPQHLTQILCGGDPRLELKRCLWEQIPKKQLVPFDIEHPASGNMFFGRQSELAELQGSTSLAIAGPGRIGKTSLLLEYRRRLVRERNPLASVTFLVDLYACSDKTADGVARKVAMALNGNKRSAELFVHEIDHFFRSEKTRLGKTPQVLIDEVDEVLETGGVAFDNLGKAARGGLCRLVLTGKRRLYAAMNKDRTTFGHRLELLRPEPLSIHAVKDLALQPFQDLGFQLVEPERLAVAFFAITGGLPQNVQFCCKRLAKLALDRSASQITPTMVEELRNDDLVHQHLLSPLNELDASLRSVAAGLLQHQQRPFPLAAVLALCPKGTTPERASEIADTLVILNVLSWNKELYRVANQVLTEHHMGRVATTGGD